MAHSGNTTNFNLPQFTGTDHPSFTGDFNEAFLNLDNFLKDISTLAEQAQAAASAATKAAGAATTAAGTAQSAAEKANGLAATAQNAADNAQTRADEAYALAEQGGGGVSLEDVYPVGSIYICTQRSTNPNSIFGFGTWQRISNAYLYASSDEVAMYGGEKSFTITHEQMPSHSHDPQFSTQILGTTGGQVARRAAQKGTNLSNVITSENAFQYVSVYATTRAGNDEPVYYNPYYYAVAVWRRTA